MEHLLKVCCCFYLLVRFQRHTHILFQLDSINSNNKLITKLEASLFLNTFWLFDWLDILTEWDQSSRIILINLEVPLNISFVVLPKCYFDCFNWYSFLKLQRNYFYCCNFCNANYSAESYLYDIMFNKWD